MRLERFVFDLPRLVLGNNVQQVAVGVDGVETIELDGATLVVRQAGKPWCVANAVGSGVPDTAQRSTMPGRTPEQLAEAQAPLLSDQARKGRK